jgi:hypothetical protein
MKKIAILGLAIAALLMTGTLAMALPLTGSVSYSSGIYATSAWANTSTTLSWNVVQVGSDWQYTYTWNTTSKDLSHIIIEVTPESDVEDFTITQGSLSADSPRTFSPSDPGNSNPGLPGDIFGLKFAGTSTLQTIVFTTDHAPVWGDFYAKDGVDGQIDVYAYNTGFGLPDPDPSLNAAPGKIVVPDGEGVIVPEPVTMILLGLGLLGIGIAVRKRS